MNLRFPGKIGDCRSITLLDVIRNIDNIARTFLQEYIKKYMTSCKIYGTLFSMLYLTHKIQKLISYLNQTGVLKHKMLYMHTS